MPNKSCNACSKKSLRISILEDQLSKLTQQYYELGKIASFWESQCKSLHELHTQSNWMNLPNESFSPSALQISNLPSYLTQLMRHHKYLNTLLSTFLSKSHTKKFSASKTNSKWIQWSYLYKSFIIDTFLRSKNPKSIRRTNLILGSYFLLTNIGNPSWKLLQRLRIIPTIESVKNWLSLQPKEVPPSSSTLLYCIDNCEYFTHVTHRRSEHESQMKHIINNYIIEFPTDLTHILTPQIWNFIPRNEFGNWLIGVDNDWVFTANSAFGTFQEGDTLSPLKFILTNTPLSTTYIPQSNYTVLTPYSDKSTSSPEEIQYVVDQFHLNYLLNTSRTFAFLCGDHQVFIQLWKLRMSQREKYSWMIPIPGEWHWTWHLLQAIFKIYGKYILLPFSQFLGFKNLDIKGGNFHYAEDFLEIVTLACFKWIVKRMQNFPHLTPIQWMETLQNNTPAYELIYATLYYFIPYFVTRSSIKFNFPLIEELLKYWLPIFIATNKYHYSLITMRYAWILKSLHPLIKQEYLWNRVFSFSGKSGTGMGMDCFIELVNIFYYD